MKDMKVVEAFEDYLKAKKCYRESKKHVLQNYPTLSNIWSRRLLYSSFEVDKKRFRYTCVKKISIAYPVYEYRCIFFKNAPNYFYFDAKRESFTIFSERGGIAKEDLSVIKYPSYYVQDEDMIIAEHLRLLRIKRVQRQVRKWIGKPYYSNGKRGLVFRKAQDDYEKEKKKVKG